MKLRSDDIGLRCTELCSVAPRHGFAGTWEIPSSRTHHATGCDPRATDAEQRAIAAALSDVDALLGGLDRLIAKKRDLKQAAMQQLLTGQTRLPGFHGEWEVKTLFELAERKKELFDDGDWIESEHITSEGIRLIQTGNIGMDRFIEKETSEVHLREVVHVAPMQAIEYW